MAVRATNTMSEVCALVAKELTGALAYPDADIPWLQQQIMTFTQKARDMDPSIPGEGPGAQAPPSGPGDLMGGNPIQMAPGMPGGANGIPSLAGGGGPAGGMGGAPNMDDLGRILRGA